MDQSRRNEIARSLLGNNTVHNIGERLVLASFQKFFGRYVFIKSQIKPGIGTCICDVPYFGFTVCIVQTFGLFIVGVYLNRKKFVDCQIFDN
jgi:hypothetical protein